MKFRSTLVSAVFAVLAVLAGLHCQLTAQIPPNSTLVSTQVSGTATNGLISVTTTGKATTLTGHGRGTHLSVALSHHDPFAVWALGGWPTIGSAPVGHYLLSGYSAATKGSGDGVVGQFGAVQRCHIFKNNLLITFSSVTPGLYKRPRLGGNAVLVASIPEAFDITSLNGKVYVTTYSTAGRNSALHEVDMSVTPAKTRIVKIAPGSGTAPAVFKAIGTYGWESSAVSLLIGDSNGKLWFVDPAKTTNNAFTVTFGSSRGMAEAIMTHPDQSVGVVIATSTGLYKQTDYNTGGKPFYTAPNTTPIRDIAVLGGGKAAFGNGCPGSKGEPVHGHGLNSWPYNGNALFALEMDNGPSTTPGTLILGLSRSTWSGAKLPLDLTFMGAPNCYLNVSLLLQIGVTTDGNGHVVLRAPIPLDTKLIGANLFVQWAIFEKAANWAGLITSKGLKLTVR